MNERGTKGETCADQMTDSFQVHEDVMQFLSRTAQLCAVSGCPVYSLCVALFMRVFMPRCLLMLVKNLYVYLFPRKQRLRDVTLCQQHLRRDFTSVRVMRTPNDPWDCFPDVRASCAAKVLAPAS